MCHTLDDREKSVWWDPGGLRTDEGMVRTTPLTVRENTDNNKQKDKSKVFLGSCSLDLPGSLCRPGLEIKVSTRLTPGFSPH